MTVLAEYVDLPKRVFNYKQFLEQLAWCFDVISHFLPEIRL